MQCPSCGFQNLPGLGECARCSSLLALADVDVRPYRASEWGVGRRHRLWMHFRGARPTLRRRIAAFIAERFPNAGRRGAGEPSVAERCHWVIAALVPGLGHMASGRWRAGWRLLGGYVLSLLLAILFMSSLWTLCMAVALGIHTYSIVDCVFHRSLYFPRWQPIVLSLLTLPLLMYAVYGPVRWFINGFGRFEPVSGRLVGPVLCDGDVLLAEGRWIARGTYQPGDVVSYGVPRLWGQGWYVPEGVQIDRILAGPGDRVQVLGHRLRINGRRLPPNRESLGVMRLPKEYDQVVPEGSYFIYPSLAPFQNPGYRNSPEIPVRMELSLVPADRIRGRVLWRVNPLPRWGPLGE